jgi:hypothetical protein
MEITMTDITYDNVAAPAPAGARTTARKGVWRRMLEAMIEARMRQAERIVREYREIHPQL